MYYNFLGDFTMKKVGIVLIVTLLITGTTEACRNTISNNTNTVYKIAEIREGNKDLKKDLYLPNEYLKDEQKAHTLNPGEEVSFGGHYLPTFAVFKEYPDNKWHSLLVVKQNECGPRGPENKYLLLTDVLRCKLPDDYNPVYTFVRRKLPEEMEDVSKNKNELTKIANPYQELEAILDDATQKILELMSRLMETCPASKDAVQQPPVLEQIGENTSDEPTNGDDDGKTCGACAA